MPGLRWASWSGASTHMPEGPEIWKAAASIASVLDHQELQDVEFTQPHLRRFNKLLQGQRVMQVQARGKAILTHIDNGLSIYSHNQLYGRWYVRKAGGRPKTGRTLRLALTTPTHSALLYSASEIEVLDDTSLHLHPYLRKLGPDALDQSVCWQDIAERLQMDRFRRRSLASLYLDQHFVAGIGNYLRSEILYVAKVHPKRRPVDLTRGEIGALGRATLDITRRSLATGGITNPPRRAAKLKRDGYKYEAFRFAVFSRTGQPCYECNAPIERMELSGRRLYLCSSCQTR